MPKAREDKPKQPQPEPKQPQAITFSYRDVATALVRHARLNEGKWGVYAEFGIGAGNIGDPEGNLMPAAIVPVVKFGLVPVTELNTMSVDAAEVNPATTSVTKLGGKTSTKRQRKKAV